jgi:hypothetical protein
VPNRVDMAYKTRTFSGTSWSSGTDIETSVMEDHTVFNTTGTYNGDVHLIYEQDDELIYESYDGSWSGQTTIDSDVETATPRGISSVSNDVFLVWKTDASNYLRYKQYDAIPLAPQNLTITESDNNHPYLAWNTNEEPDINKYYIYRKDQYGGGWQYLAQTSNTYYEDETLTYCHAIPPSQCPNERNFDFYVTAIDLSSNESDSSNNVSADLVGSAPDKISIKGPQIEKTGEFSLKQNHPNPFNPTTQINYSVKTTSEVTLKVYDMLGKEVASLVNGRKEPGNYSVTFNAENLPSGIYVYKLTAGKFTTTKKLLLIK